MPMNMEGILFKPVKHDAKTSHSAALAMEKDKDKDKEEKAQEQEYDLPDTIPDWHGHLDPSVKEHPLCYKYCIWYMRRASRTEYNKNIKKIGSFSTIEGFWRIYNHILRPDQMTVTTDYHIFKEGIKPIWEDPANQKGGKWIIRLKKGLSSYYWEILLFAIIGESFYPNCQKNICGAVLSIRYNEDYISLWNQTADKEILYKLRDHLRILLDLPYFVSLEYKRHDASLVDNSSYRNTTVWRGNNTTSTNNIGDRNSSGSGQQNTTHRYTNKNNMNTRNNSYGQNNSGQMQTGGEQRNKQYHYHSYNKGYNNNAGESTEGDVSFLRAGRNYNDYDKNRRQNDTHDKNHRRDHDSNANRRE